jgi:phage gp29-like protein
MPGVASITPQYVEMVLRGALAGDHARQWELFDLMADTWPELAACMQELSDGVAGLQMTFTPFAEEDEAASDEAVERCRLVSAALRAMKPDAAAGENEIEGTVRDITDGWFRGITVLETLWSATTLGTHGQAIVPRATAWAHPSHYALGADGRFGLVEKTGVVPFPEHKFILGIHRAKSGPTLGGALLRPLAWWWCASNFAADWVLGLAELFGIPFRSAKFDPNAPQATIDAICSMLQNMGARGYGAFPTGTEIEFMDVAKGSDHSPQGELLDRADRYARLVILGQTQSGGKGSAVGGQAFGEVESGVKAARIKAAARYVARVLNTELIPAILTLNYGDAEQSPSVCLVSEKEEDKAKLATVVQTLATAGAGKIIGLDWLGKTFGIPKPDKGEETLDEAKPAPEPGKDLNRQGAEDAKGAEEEKKSEDDTDANLARIAEIKDDALFSKALADFANTLV